MKKFEELTEREVLALAIALEEEDERVYADFADGLRQDYPATAAMFMGMREEESEHRRRLIELFRQKFGEHIPLIRRQDVRGFVERPALWLVRPLRIEAVRKEASTMEVETRRFYEKAAARTQDASIRQLLDDLAYEERSHEKRAQEFDKRVACQREGRGRTGAAPSFRSANRAARTRRPDGRFGLNPCARLRRRIRHARHLGSISRRVWPHPSAQASAWDSPKLSPTMEA